MAAETSTEAYIPVMIALGKLAVVYTWEYLKEFEVKKRNIH